MSVHKLAKRTLIKLAVFAIFVICLSTVFDVVDYNAQNALAMQQMDIYGTQAGIQIYHELHRYAPIVYLITFYLMFKKDVKEICNRIKNH